jgi:hypothetical protein
MGFKNTWSNSIKEGIVDTTAEIHAINNKLTEIISSITLIKERRLNDKEDITELSEIVNKLSISINQLNLTLKYKDGQIDGASKIFKAFRIIFGSLIFIAIVSSAAFMWNINERVTSLEPTKVKA